MKIAVISGHVGMHGSTVNLLDFMDYLIRKGNRACFYCLSLNQFFTNIFKTKRRYTLTDIREIEQKIIADSVITDFKTLCILKTPIHCQKLTVFDCAELTYNIEGITTPFHGPEIRDIDIREQLKRHKYKHIKFLMPPANVLPFTTKYPELPYSSFFKRINMDVLKTIKNSDNGKLFYRVDEPVNGLVTKPVIPKHLGATELKDLTKMFEYHGYVYWRRADRARIEQFGRMIFEFMLLGKKVVFLDKPDDKKDGLSDYYKYYNPKNPSYFRAKMASDYEIKPWEI